jgi:hypothetical protein
MNVAGYRPGSTANRGPSQNDVEPRRHARNNVVTPADGSGIPFQRPPILGGFLRSCGFLPRVLASGAEEAERLISLLNGASCTRRT